MAATISVTVTRPRNGQMGPVHKVYKVPRPQRAPLEVGNFGPGGPTVQGAGQSLAPGLAYQLALQQAAQQMGQQVALQHQQRMAQLWQQGNSGLWMPQVPVAPGPGRMGVAQITHSAPPEARRFLPEVRSEALQGWREYRLLAGEDDEPEMLITGAGTGFVYQGRLAEAVCDNFVAAKVEASTPEVRCVEHLEQPELCACGFWARATRGKGANFFHYETGVWGRVLGFGTVAADAAGNWRASELQLEELFLDPGRVSSSMLGRNWQHFFDWGRIVSLLRDRYAVPVRLEE